MRSWAWEIHSLSIRESLPSDGTSLQLPPPLIFQPVNNSPHFFVLGVRFDPISADDAVARFDRACQEQQKLFCVTPNPEICLYASFHPNYLDILNGSGLSIPDGFGILWAHRYLQGSQNFWRWLWTLLTPPITKKISRFRRVTGTDVMRLFCKRFPKRKIFLLGAATKVNHALTEKLLLEGVSVVGSSTDGPSHDQDIRLCDQINASGAEVLLVAFGAPKQEEWIARNFSKLKRVSVVIGVGGAFDFLSGAKKCGELFTG